MEKNEQQLIDELFGHLAEVERSSGPRDAEAERYIGQLMTRQPGVAYFMTQSLIIQEQALMAAQQHIAELERSLAGQASGGGSFLGGRAQTSVPATGSVPPAGGGFRYPPAGEPMRYEQPPASGSSGIGGFLAGAAQTAAGVAGGVVLGNMITGMFSGHHGGGNQTIIEREVVHDSPNDDRGSASHEADFAEADYNDDFGGGGFDDSLDI